MNVLDLFSGIGGFSLGLERAGMRTVAFCEQDIYCQRVLTKHWPTIRIFGDVRELTAERLAATAASGDIAIDVICGGFPCQDISLAGKGAGIDGERSGLWREYARIIGEVRPRYVIVENVAILLNRGLDRVLGDLASIGYDAEWHCIPASAIGAPHRRDRIWIVAYPQSERRGKARPDSERHSERSTSGGDVLAYTDRPRLSLAWSESLGTNGKQSWRVPSTGDWWAIEPSMGRMAHGIPGRVDRLRQLGNSVVPQIPEIIGRAIMKSALTQG